MNFRTSNSSRRSTSNPENRRLACSCGSSVPEINCQKRSLVMVAARKHTHTHTHTHTAQRGSDCDKGCRLNHRTHPPCLAPHTPCAGFGAASAIHPHQAADLYTLKTCRNERGRGQRASALSTRHGRDGILRYANSPPSSRHFILARISRSLARFWARALIVFSSCRVEYITVKPVQYLSPCFGSVSPAG